MDPGPDPVRLKGSPASGKDGGQGHSLEEQSARVLSGSVDHKDDQVKTDQDPSPFSFPDINAALDLIPVEPAKPAKKEVRTREKRTNGDRVESGCVVGGQGLPEFHIWSEAEPMSANCEDNSKVMKMLKEYELAQKTKRTRSSKAGLPPGPKAGQSDQWDVEQYEGTPSDSKQFRLFQKRLKRRPDQCVRYG